MLNNYKKFLLNKLEKEIDKLKKVISSETNIYSNFIDSELFCVVETKNQLFLIVLNSYKDITFEIEHKIGNYKRFTKNKIKDKIHKLSFKKLLKNGLYMSEYSGENSYDSLCTVQRLVCCLRENCINKEVNHIDGNPLNNNIHNLEALEHTEHSKVTTQNRRKRRKENEIFLSL